GHQGPGKSASGERHYPPPALLVFVVAPTESGSYFGPTQLVYKFRRTSSCSKSARRLPNSPSLPTAASTSCLRISRAAACCCSFFRKRILPVERSKRPSFATQKRSSTS